ncbi:MAG: hypothetical protein K1Y02_13010 [Candidatus Hydrogenedentes bacterium]|nr:hypothetical protein [Candidatus Hydrogenedentota bacterium]
MIEFLSRASSLHAIVVHFPVALSIVAIPLVYLCAAGRGERNDLRWVAFGCYVIVLITSFLAVQTGHGAMDHIPSSMSSEVWSTVERHEVMAEKVWIFALITAALIALSALRIRTVRIAAASLAVISSVLTAGWVGITGHFGGTLVYEYGVGTPAMHASAETPARNLAPVPQPEPAATPVTETPAPVEPPAAPEAPMAPASDPAVAPAPAPEPAPAPAPAPEAPIPAPETPAPAVTTPATPEVAPESPVGTESPSAEALIPAIRDYAPEEAKLVSYKKDVAPIFELHCVECHNPDKSKGDFDVTTVSTLLLPGKKAGPGVVPGKPDESSVVEYIRGAKRPQMPKGEAPISEQELHIIRMWIAAGAVDDSAQPTLPATETAEAAPAVPAQ